MVTENRKNTLRIWLVKFVATVIFTPLIMVFSFSIYFSKPVLGFDRICYIYVLCVIYAGIFVYYWLLRPYFVYFNDQGDRIIMRYYAVRAFNRKKYAIEIPKKDFVRFESERFFFGNERLTLYQRFRNGVGKFPSVSLSAVKRSDRKKIKAALTSYTK
jgi:hypothetical protein